MDTVLLIIAAILILSGIAGCILPVIPGPPLSFFGIWLLHFTKYASFETRLLLILAFIATIATILDYAAPVWTTRRFGGSKKGIWGAAIGMVAGLILFPPFGIIIGPFAGAIAGELFSGAEIQKALKAGLGSFAGFFLGMGLKLAASLAITYYFVRAVF